ncbi:MAG: hypothetical protein KHY89_08085 [Butyricicoccus pullicaecorum]|nr:hypothetical protein [Butyricicoccus pullicaecorum]
MKTLSYTQRKYITMYSGLAEGILALCILLAGLFFRTTLIPDEYTFSAFVGISCGMMGAGFSVFFQTRKLLHNPERLHQSEIRDMDERNQYIAAQSARLSFWASIIFTYVISFFALFFSVRLYFFLCIQILVMLALYLLFGYIFCKVFS